jgi:taurine dioxygenase
MFVTFFQELKSAGVPVTLREYLTLMEAMDADLASRRIEDFYYLSRAALIKDERNLDKPPMATMLVARETPPFGGDTLFANMYLAYETLSDGLKRMLDGLIAINKSAKADVTRTREDRVKDSGKTEAKKEYVSEHPVVRTHPETGRKALYVNVGHTAHFKDMTVEESAPLLNYLFQHQTRPEFTCRFSWKPGSVAFWDNRCVLHNPVNDYHGYRRVMHRVTLAGDVPR